MQPREIAVKTVKKHFFAFIKKVDIVFSRYGKHDFCLNKTQRIHTMVKTVKFLALSLLVPSLALAMVPSGRDLTHALAGAAEGYVQNQLGHNVPGVALAATGAGLADHAKGITLGYLGKSALSAIAFGRLHNEVVGTYINSKQAGQDTTVTLRDNNFRTLGHLAVNFYNNSNKADSSVAFKAIDPFHAVAALQYAWSKKASIWQATQTAEQAAQAAYIAAQAAKKAKK